MNAITLVACSSRKHHASRYGALPPRDPCIGKYSVTSQIARLPPD
jgi:hypothetical protein